MLLDRYAECHCAECQDCPQGQLSAFIVILRVVMLSVLSSLMVSVGFYCYAECHVFISMLGVVFYITARCHYCYVDCRYAECPGAVVHSTPLPGMESK